MKLKAGSTKVVLYPAQVKLCVKKQLLPYPEVELNSVIGDPTKQVTEPSRMSFPHL